MYRLLAVVLLAAVALAADEKPVTKPNVTARGYHGAAQDPVPPVATQPIYYPVYPPPPGLEDRNVCDLDAGVLLVTDRRHRHHHGQYKAVRVRCSEIANYDEDSCNICCQNAARRDRNLPNTAMFGFLALTDNGHKHHKDSKEDKSKHSNEPKSLEDDEDENTRKKRGADWSKEHEPEQTRVKQEDWIPDPQYKNLKCVCCAPKRPLPVYQFPVYQQPAYGQPQYPQQQPTYQQQQPVQNYQAPAQQPQQYVSPPASPPQQNYAAQAPAQTYQAPAQAPAQYQAPAQAPAQYQAQAPPAQTYQPPAQQPPQQSYQQPAQAPAAPPTNYQSQQQAPVSY